MEKIKRNIMWRTDIPGPVADGTIFSDAGKVEVRCNYNGSGPNAFGGIREWPVVRVQVSFCEGEEERAIDFAKAITEMIQDEIDKEGDGG